MSRFATLFAYLLQNKSFLFTLSPPYTANVTHDYQSCVSISCSPVVFSGNISCIIYSYLPYYDCFWYFLALSAVAITIISCTLPAVITLTTIQSYRSCTRDVYICSVVHCKVMTFLLLMRVLVQMQLGAFIICQGHGIYKSRASLRL